MSLLSALLQDFSAGRVSLHDVQLKLHDLVSEHGVEKIRGEIELACHTSAISAEDRAALLFALTSQDKTQVFPFQDPARTVSHPADSTKLLPVEIDVPEIHHAPGFADNSGQRDATEVMRGGAQIDQTLHRHATSELSDQAQQTLLRHSTSETLVREPGVWLDRTQVLADRRAQFLADQPSAPTLNPGGVIKQRFVLESVIGKGGMGLVFCALDRRKLEANDPNPRVALKVLNADFRVHPDGFIALQREARKAQSLAHPNVVTVFDFDRDGDVVYMTMELLEGQSLEEIVASSREGLVPRDQAINIIRGIAEGLSYAHRKGIVHSDLKPGNVFLTSDGTPKILDFGIARAVPNPNAPDAMLDQFDAGVLGAYTEAYATDEMVAGVAPHPADDLYALGIIAYELLTGAHPFGRVGAVEARRRKLEPPPIRGLSRRQCRALERCLCFEREQRPRDASDFLKLFFGTRRVQRSLLAVVAALSITAGYFWYENQQELAPAVPFEQLSPDVQTKFQEAMRIGDMEWSFYRKESNTMMLTRAIESYARAYELHPRNPDTVAALKRAGKEFLEQAGTHSEKRKERAQFLRQTSRYFERYPPVRRVLEE